MLERHKFILLRYPDQSPLELPWLSNWIFPFLSKPGLQSLAIYSYASTFSSVLRHFFQHTRWPSKGNKQLCAGKSCVFKFIPPNHNLTKKTRTSGNFVHSIHSIQRENIGKATSKTLLHNSLLICYEFCSFTLLNYPLLSIEIVLAK